MGVGLFVSPIGSDTSLVTPLVPVLDDLQYGALSFTLSLPKPEGKKDGLPGRVANRLLAQC